MGGVKITNISKKLTVFTVILFFFSLSFSTAQTNASDSQNTNNEVISENSPEENPESKSVESSFDEKSYTYSASGNSEGSQDYSVNGVWVFFRMIIVLAAVVAVIWLLFKFVRKNTGVTSDEKNPFLRNVFSVNLGLNKSVQIVTLVDKAYIVGVCDGNISLIDKLDPEKDKQLISAINLYYDTHAKDNKPKTFEELFNLFMPSKNRKNAQNSSSKENGTVYDQSTSEIMDRLKNLHFKDDNEEK